MAGPASRLARHSMRSLQSIAGRTWTAWRPPGRFTKNPDVVSLPDGRLLAVYAETDKHWAEGLIELTLIQSRDLGRTWSHAGVVERSDRSRREPHWVTPRLAIIGGRRLVVTCDRDDFEHAHEAQDPGIYAWWSDDWGRSWSAPVNTGVRGIEPDRVIELPDGRLSMGSHMVVASTQKLTEFIWRSADGGRTWGTPVQVAGDPVHLYCEGAYVNLRGGALACVLRDNLHQNYPSQVAFSFDGGDSWSDPQEAPFAGDRPYACQVPDGRVLVTYRNKGGTPGTHAWLGHLGQELGYRVSSTRRGQAVREFDAGGSLVVHHPEPATTQFNLLPPESYRSEVLFEAQVRVAGTTGSPDEACAMIRLAHVNVRLAITPTGLVLGQPDLHHQSIDRTWPADMTIWRTVRVHHRAGLVRIFLDGIDVLRFRLPLPGPFVPTCFGSPERSTGTSFWRTVSYATRNPSEPAWTWLWDAASARLPDQYQVDRMVELHANSHEFPDNGYSSWVPVGEDRYLVLDYTNDGDPLGQSHVVACDLRLADFEDEGGLP